MSTNKKPICYNSDKCRAMKSVEPWIWKIVRIFPQILHYLHCKRRWSQLFLCFRASNPRKHFDFRSRFLCFQTANQKNWIKFENPMSPEPFDSRAKAPPAKRWEKGYGDENGPKPDYFQHKVGRKIRLHGSTSFPGSLIFPPQRERRDSLFSLAGAGRWERGSTWTCLTCQI